MRKVLKDVHWETYWINMKLHSDIEGRQDSRNVVSWMICMQNVNWFWTLNLRLFNGFEYPLIIRFKSLVTHKVNLFSVLGRSSLKIEDSVRRCWAFVLTLALLLLGHLLLDINMSDQQRSSPVVSPNRFTRNDWPRSMRSYPRGTSTSFRHSQASSMMGSSHCWEPSRGTSSTPSSSGTPLPWKSSVIASGVRSISSMLGLVETDSALRQWSFMVSTRVSLHTFIY